MNPVAIATSNPGKVAYLSSFLTGTNFESFVWFKAEQSQLEGDNAKVNAKSKAMQSSKLIELPVLATDEELHFNFLETIQQPGALIKRMAGPQASDQEILSFYENLLSPVKPDERRGKITTHIAVAIGGNLVGYTTFTQHCLFKLPHAEVWKKGRPLSALHYINEFERFYSELSEEEIRQVDEPFVDQLLIFMKALPL